MSDKNIYHEYITYFEYTRDTVDTLISMIKTVLDKPSNIRFDNLFRAEDNSILNFYLNEILYFKNMLNQDNSLLKVISNRYYDRNIYFYLYRDKLNISIQLLDKGNFDYIYKSFIKNNINISTNYNTIIINNVDYLTYQKINKIVPFFLPFYIIISPKSELEYLLENEPSEAIKFVKENIDDYYNDFINYVKDEPSYFDPIIELSLYYIELLKEDIDNENKIEYVYSIIRDILSGNKNPTNNPLFLEALFKSGNDKESQRLRNLYVADYIKLPLGQTLNFDVKIDINTIYQLLKIIKDCNNQKK